MSNISFQIIPFAFIFVVVLFFLAKKKNKKKEVITTKEMPLIDYVEHAEFFEDAEKKLIALKELYRQELIDKNMYVKKVFFLLMSYTIFYLA